MMKNFKTINHKFPEDQYYKIETEKKQIVLHHTASGDDATGDINWWKQTVERVATCLIIDRDGTLHTLFSSKHWAHHLGIKVKVFDDMKIPRIYRKDIKTGNMFVANNVILNEGSLPVEIDSWGQLEKIGNKFYSWTKQEVPPSNVIDYGVPVRGFRYYEKYTDKQLETLQYVLKYWNKEYDIPIKYNQDMWHVTKEALKGEPGLYSHVSYRLDKTDCHPQQSLIDMLKSNQ